MHCVESTLSIHKFQFTQTDEWEENLWKQLDLNVTFETIDRSTLNALSGKRFVLTFIVIIESEKRGFDLMA